MKKIKRVTRHEGEIPFDSPHNDVYYVRESVNMIDFWEIIEFHREAGDGFGHFPLHWHKCIEIIIPKEGNAEVWMKNKNYIVNPGMMIIIESCVIHSSRRSEFDQPYNGYAVFISWEYLNRIVPSFEKLSFPDKPVKISKEMMENLKIISEIKSENQLTGAISADIRMNEFLIYLISEYAYTADHSIPQDQHDLVVAAMRIIEENCCSDQPVSRIASQLHVSYAYLSRLFKAQTGLTMLQMRDRFRLEKAKAFLSTTDLSFEEISGRVGFSGSGQFSRSFRKSEGCTPSEYRKKS